jgi:hypothetical protein
MSINNDTRAWLRRVAQEGGPSEPAETACPDPVVARVCALLMARSAVGVRKYGVTLERGDLSRKQWLRHAQEEALDLACYLQRLIDMEDEAP